MAWQWIRCWRLAIGMAADALGIRAAIWIVAALTMLSGLVVAARMYETLSPIEDAVTLPRLGS